MKGWVELFRVDDQANSRLFIARRPITLKRAQRLVGGYVEPVPDWHHVMHNDGQRYPALALCNEDGRSLGLPVNLLATMRWERELRIKLNPRHFLVGTVVLMFGDVHFTEEGWG